MSNTEKALSGVGYLMKYLSKLGECSIFPQGLRLYGVGGLDSDGRNIRQWLNLPQWVKVQFGVGDVKRKSGIGLVVVETGEILPPMYSVRVVPGGLIISLLRPLPEKWQGEFFGAYSSLP